jgi:hypothetical protein
MQIFELFGSILLKDDGIENKLDSIDKKASKTGLNMDNIFKGFGSTLLKVGSTLGVGLGLKSFIDDASEAEDGVSQLNAVLTSTKSAAGLTADEVTNMAGALQKVTKFSDDTILGGQNLLLTFTKIGKDIFPLATETMLDMSQALGQDMKASATQLGKALNDPIAGITALSRVGVNFTDKQKEQIKTLVESGKTMEAQKLILAELSVEFGGSAKAAGETFGGQLARLKNQVGEVSEGIGGKLLPKLGNLATYVLANMPKIQETIDKVVTLVIDKGSKIATLLGEIATKFFPDLVTAGGNAKTSMTDLSEKGFDLVIGALTWIKDNIGLVRLGVEALTAVWIIQQGIVLAHNVALVAHNVAQGVKMAQDKAETIAIVALYVAEGIHNGVLAAGTASQWLFNAAMTANPIGIVIVALAALGVAIYEVVKHWKDIVEWIEKAWNWLKTWNDTPIADKTSTVTTTHVTVYGGTGDDSNYDPVPDTGTGLGYGYASGTDYASSGWHWVGENGPELMNFKGGEQVIPHNDSINIASNNSKQIEKESQVTSNTYNINANFPNVSSKKDIEEAFNSLFNNLTGRAYQYASKVR